MDDENKKKESEEKKAFSLKKPNSNTGGIDKTNIQKTIMLKRTVAREKLKSGDASAGGNAAFGRTLKLKLKSISDTEKNDNDTKESNFLNKKETEGKTKSTISKLKSLESQTVDNSSKKENLDKTVKLKVNSKKSDSSNAFDKTIKLQMNQSVEKKIPITAENIAENNAKESVILDKTVKLQISGKDKDVKENAGVKSEKIPANSDDLDKTVKLKLTNDDKTLSNVQQLTEPNVAVQKNEDEEASMPLIEGAETAKKSGSEVVSTEENEKSENLGKTLKLRVRTKKTGISENSKGDAALTLKNTLKLKSSTKNKTLQNTSSLTARTIDIGRGKTTADAEESKNSGMTVKLKVPVSKIDLGDTNLINNTLKLKAKIPNIGIKKEIKKTVNDINITKTVASENIIKLKTAVKKDDKFDPLATQTIKIKPSTVSPNATVKIPIPNSNSGTVVTDTVKMPLNNTESKIDSSATLKIPSRTSASENTIKLPMPTDVSADISNSDKAAKNIEEGIKKTVDLPSFDSNTTKEELNTQTLVFEGLSLNPEPKKSVEKDEKRKEESQTIKTEIPGLGDLKGVLDELKTVKNEKIKKTVDKKATSKKGIETDGKVEITQDKKPSVVAIALASVTLVALVGVFYFALTSYVEIL